MLCLHTICHCVCAPQPVTSSFAGLKIITAGQVQTRQALVKYSANWANTRLPPCKPTTGLLCPLSSALGDGAEVSPVHSAQGPIQTGLEHLQGWAPKASRGSCSSGSPNFFLASHKQCEDTRTAASLRSRARSCSAAPAGSAQSRRRDRLMGVGRGHGTERCRPGYLARDTSSAL